MHIPKTADIRKRITKIEKDLGPLLKIGTRQQALHKLSNLQRYHRQVQSYTLNISLPKLDQKITNWLEKINNRWPKKHHPGPPKHQSSSNGKYSREQGGTEILVTNYKTLTY